MCAQTHGEVSVGHYWTEVPYVAPKLQSNNPLTNQSTHLSNSRTACRFTRPLKVNGDDRSLDLNNEWYQLYAWGPTYNSKFQFDFCQYMIHHVMNLNYVIDMEVEIML